MSTYRYQRSFRTVRVGRSKELFAGVSRCKGSRVLRLSLEDLVVRRVSQGVRTLQGLREAMGVTSAELDRAVGSLLSRKVIEGDSLGYRLPGPLPAGMSPRPARTDWDRQGAHRPARSKRSCPTVRSAENRSTAQRTAFPRGSACRQPDALVFQWCA